MSLASDYSSSRLPWLAAWLMFWIAGAAFAQQQGDPPARVAHLGYAQGSVVYAPEGEDEWLDLPQNRPLTIGDRLWTDRGSRAELEVGTGTVHMDGETQLGISALDDRAAQFIVQQGSVNARVRDLAAGENFEIDTPNLALRALQPGDYRVDVAADGGATRVAIHSGVATVFGEDGRSIRLGAGQQMTFGGRTLLEVARPPYGQDEFDAWSAARNSMEDQSLAARYVPRGVVGYSDLDSYGVWSQAPDYGTVWYPNVSVADWAPYRYGHWAWIQPWGWTWVDDAPWGFAPFHYGRWAMIGNRWAWVPGRLPARPIYAPALVAFFGDDGGGFSTGPAVGWYPLAPGEPWWPTYRHSARYLGALNLNLNLNAYPRRYDNDRWRRSPNAVTVVRDEDFRRGRPVHEHRERVEPGFLSGVRPGFVPPRPTGRPERPERSPGFAPRLQSAPPSATQPAMPSRAWGSREGVPQRVRPDEDNTRSRQEAPLRAQPGQRVEQEQRRLQQQQQQQQEPAPRGLLDLRQQALDRQRAEREAQRLQQEQQQRNAQELRQQQERQRAQRELQRQQQQESRLLQQQRQQQETQQRLLREQQRVQQEQQRNLQEQQRLQRERQQRAVPPPQVQQPAPAQVQQAPRPPQRPAARGEERRREPDGRDPREGESRGRFQRNE